MARAALLLTLSVAAASCASGPPGPASSLDQIYLPGQNTAFGAQQDHHVWRAEGASPTGAPLTAEQTPSSDGSYGAGQNTAFGADHAPQPPDAPPDVRPRVSATVPMVADKPDIVGNGGRQDGIAKEIYHTGHDLTEMLGGG